LHRPDSIRAGLGVAGQSLTVAQWQDGRGNVIDSPQAQLAAQAVLVAGQVDPKGMEMRRTAALKRFIKNDREKQPVVMPRDLKLPKCGPGVSVFIPPIRSSMNADVR